MTSSLPQQGIDPVTRQVLDHMEATGRLYYSERLAWESGDALAKAAIERLARSRAEVDRLREALTDLYYAARNVAPYVEELVVPPSTAQDFAAAMVDASEVVTPKQQEPDHG